MQQYIATPPVVFFIILASVGVFALLLSVFAFRNKAQSAGTRKGYSCGEDEPDNKGIQPDYSRFFHFAFFFTVLHVVALFVATAPGGAVSTAGVAVVYVAGAVAGLFILLEK